MINAGWPISRRREEEDQEATMRQLEKEALDKREAQVREEREKMQVGLNEMYHVFSAF